ncbi:MAG: polysaccharide pyruvyl transferase family protein [Oscillospiraceae bacterium]|nr:polysaccharide pyruvyl transferase family protein [Oscillospiraceae bacterium]
MKIGILTFHRSINYGAFLQCYSLSKRLQQDFPQHQVQVVDYTSDKIQEMYDREISEASVALRAKLLARTEAFRSVWNTLPLTEESFCGGEEDALMEFLNRTFDVLIVGSDAVWNWKIRGFPNPYFLKDFKGIKLSYAASCHGQRYRTMTEEQKAYLKDAFADYSFLGVRDVTTAELLHFVDPNLQSCHTCDPTMFLDLSMLPCDMDALKRKMKNAGVDFSKPLVGIMGSTNHIGRELKAYFGDRVQFVALYRNNDWADVYLYDLTPFEWGRVFSLFSATVTHFFHGTLLSLVNDTPVFAAESASPFSVEYTTKIKDVLGRMGLSDRRWEGKGCNRTFLQKVWNKLGFSVDNTMWKEICSGIENVLHGNGCSVSSKVKEEAQSYENFRVALERCLRR